MKVGDKIRVWDSMRTVLDIVYSGIHRSLQIPYWTLTVTSEHTKSGTIQLSVFEDPNK